jgi:predicted ATP-grasp superfamily ATP-dependent carboligase
MSFNPVLVLDSDQRSALAVIRSLGARGVLVIAAERHARSLGGASRHARERAVYPDPSVAPAEFQRWLREWVAAHPGALVLPMTDLTLPLVLEIRDSLPTALPFPSLDDYRALSDKRVTAEAARAAGIAVPATISVSRAAPDPQALRALRFPVVLKPQVSVLRTAAGVVKEGVRYLGTPVEVEDFLRSHPYSDDAPFLVQELVNGRGYGVFVLFDHGRPLGFFSHLRLRERPPSGGVSVLSESAPLDSGLCERVARMFAAHRWHGVAMAEFKLPEDGEPVLIEVNGRFWGSLQLAVDSGVDFPWLLYQLARGEAASVPRDYAVGRRLRWWLGDLDHLLLSLRGGLGWRAVWTFLRPSPWDTRLELLRADDPRPAFRALRNYFS